MADDTITVNLCTCPLDPAEPLPECLRTAAVDSNNDVYVSVTMVIADSHEEMAAKIAQMDGETVIDVLGHPFVRISWLAEKLPDRKDELAELESAIRESYENAIKEAEAK